MTATTPTSHCRPSHRTRGSSTRTARYRGLDEIRQWLQRAASEFTYTRTFLSVEAQAADTWLILNRLEGDFPGGVVDLRYKFVLTADLITELLIAP